MLWSKVFGFVDTITGLGLIFLPAFTLGLMGLDSADYSLSLVMFIGAFVLGVGSLYFMGLLLSRREKSLVALRHVWLATGWVRICVAIVTGALIARGGLDIRWVSVPLTDALVGGVQLSVVLWGRFTCHE